MSHHGCGSISSGTQLVHMSRTQIYGATDFLYYPIMALNLSNQGQKTRSRFIYIHFKCSPQRFGVVWKLTLANPLVYKNGPFKKLFGEYNLCKTIVNHPCFDIFLSSDHPCIIKLDIVYYHFANMTPSSAHKFSAGHNKHEVPKLVLFCLCFY